MLLLLVHLSVCGDHVCDENEDCDSCAVDCCGSELPEYVIVLIVVLFVAVVAMALGGMVAVSEKYMPTTTTHQHTYTFIERHRLTHIKSCTHVYSIIQYLPIAKYIYTHLKHVYVHKYACLKMGT